MSNTVKKIGPIGSAVSTYNGKKQPHRPDKYYINKNRNTWKDNRHVFPKKLSIISWDFKVKPDLT